MEKRKQIDGLERNQEPCHVVSLARQREKQLDGNPSREVRKLN